MSEIAKMFKQHREALGLSQAQLGEKLCVSPSMIGQIEVGLKMPTVSLVRLAAELFGCTTDELIFGSKRESA